MSDPVARLNAALEGRYRIEGELGEGGMATVYLAHDLKHERRVALKVLKPELAAAVGAERFLAEIKTTANLQHPHILPLFDSGEADSFLFYVMPYVEGETLRQRLDREKQLPVDEAVALASKVAGALQNAHEHNIIHRDIKPANILLQGGEPVVADFGISLAVGVAGGNRITEAGLSLGTPHYMSPEQATGDQLVGSSTDTFALGSVLYEMLVGDPPFQGSTAQAVLGKIIAGGLVSAAEHRPSVPANVDAALRKTLEKLPADRFSSAQEFARALADPGFRYGELEASSTGTTAGPWNRLTMGFAAAFLVTTIALGVVWSLAPDESPSMPTRRFIITLPADGVLKGGTVQPLAISNDGRTVIMNMATVESGEFLSELFVRPLENLDAVPIRGTGNVGSFYVSPDGEWVAFNNISDGSLQKVPLDGGPPVTISESGLSGGVFQGASWGEEGTIVFATSRYPGLLQVPDSGGVPQPLTTPDEASQEQHVEPHLLPGGETVLFVVQRPGELDQITALSLASGQYETLVPGSWPHYVGGDRLVFLREDALWAITFDPRQLAVTGEAVRVLEGLEGPFAISGDGTLVFAPFTEATGSPRSLVWIDREGQEQPVGVESQPYVYPRISPQGNRLAVAIAEDVANNNSEADLWVFDLDRGSRSRITFGGNNRFFPVWTPAGDGLTYTDGPAADPNRILLATFAGGGDAVTLLEREGLQYPTSWSGDGQTLAFYENDPETARDLWVLPVGGEPQPFLVTPFQERAPAFSPDGRWLAYVSNQSGADEVYVLPYPGPGPEFTLSTAGGREPVWSRDGSELFYRIQGQLMVVTVELGETFRAGTPRPLFDDTFERDNSAGGIGGVPNYDVTPNGERFVMVRVDPAGEDHVVVVLNWFDDVRERMEEN